MARLTVQQRKKSGLLCELYAKCYESILQRYSEAVRPSVVLSMDEKIVNLLPFPDVICCEL